jgi:hypothetical protein
MRLVYAGRRKGKTTASVEAVRRTNGLLLVSSYRERDRIIREFGKKDKNGVYHGVQPHQVITVQDLHSARFRGTKHAPRVIIDNLELVIEQLVGLHVDVVTTSVDPETVIGHQARVLAEGGMEENTEGVVEVARALPVANPRRLKESPHSKGPVIEL